MITNSTPPMSNTATHKEGVSEECSPVSGMTSGVSVGVGVDTGAAVGVGLGVGVGVGESVGVGCGTHFAYSVMLPSTTSVSNCHSVSQVDSRNHPSI